MLDLKPEQMQEYLKKITSMAQAAGCKVSLDDERLYRIHEEESHVAGIGNLGPAILKTSDSYRQKT